MHIDDQIAEKAAKDGGYAVAYALLQLAQAQKDVAQAIKDLDIPFIGERIDGAGGAIADALREVSD